MSNASDVSSVEGAFGPVVPSSIYGGFDFTLLFEESILTILPLGVALLWACLRLVTLSRVQTKVRGGLLLILKLAGYGAYSGLQIASLVFWTKSEAVSTRLTAAIFALTLASAFVFAGVSYFEHRRSLQPSTLLVLFFIISLLCDAAHVRTTFLLPDSYIQARLGLTSLVVKLALLILELVEKDRLIQAEFRDDSPEATASIANKAIFAWINSLLWRGARKQLAIEDLLPLDAELRTATEPYHLIERWSKADHGHKDSLFWAFLLEYKWTILSGVIPRLCQIGFTFAQPFLVQQVLLFMEETDPSQDVSYGLIGAYALVYTGIATSSALYEYATNRLTAQFRGSLVALIYRKTLRINPSSTADAEAITLMSADTDRIALGLNIFHESYASVIQLGLALWLLWIYLGVSMAASAVWLVLALGLGVPLASAAGNAQLPWLEAIERRLAVTAKALGQVMPIKMAGLAKNVCSQISNLRMIEIRASRRYRLFSALRTSASFLASSLTPVFGLGAYVLIVSAQNTGTLTEDVAFAALTIFDLQTQPANYFLNLVQDFQIIVNCFRRIQEYLLAAELHSSALDSQDSDRNGYSPSSSDTRADSDNEKVSTTKEKSALDVSPQNIFEAEDVYGGYSTESKPTLKSLNFSIPVSQITVVIGAVGAGKSTFVKLLLGELPSITGQIRSCFSQIAYCPQTPWITKGTIQTNIVGMSAWDQTWYNRVTAACALNQDFEELPNGDSSETGTRGSRLSGGQKARVSLARALYSRAPVMIMDNVLVGLDATTEKLILDSVFGLKGLIRELETTVVLTTNTAEHLGLADNVVALTSNGELQEHHQPEDESSEQDDTSSSVKSGTSSHSDAASQDADADDIDELLNTDDIDAARRTSDSKVYIFYMRTVGWGLMFVYFLACCCYIVSYQYPSIWVQLWTNSNATDPNNNIAYWLGIYAAIGVSTVLASMLSEMLFMMVIVPKTSKRFHEHLLETTIRATTAFLTTTDSGTTTNRFSQDLELIDNDLPQAFDLFILELMTAVSSAVLIFIGSGYLAACIPVCLVILYILQKFYLRTSRQLRLLDIEAKAPLFSQFLETLNGVTSIRAYRWTDQYLAQHVEALQASQRPYYLMYSIQRWLTLVLDLFVAGLAVLLVALAVNIRGGASSYLGVALLNVVSFSSTLQGLVTEWTQLEMSIAAVNRIRAYMSETPAEDRDDDKPEATLDVWPQQGAIEFEHVFASFGTSDDMVLKDMSLSIKPGEKVAICGRTGSGKSSLISGLLNLLNLKSGSISIDGLSISKIARPLLRERINTLPQEAIVLAGTVRENLALDTQASDQQMIAILEKLQLWPLFEQAAGLDEVVGEDSLSHGQRQLLCMARAVLKAGAVVVMDESTSSIDSDLEDIIDGVVAEAFSNSTIIAVVHKLRSALNFDRVVFVEAGRIVECDTPQKLLEDPNSRFGALYRDLAAS